MTTHTFFLAEGTWNATGEYTDEDGVVSRVQGTVTTFRRDGVLIHDGRMTVLRDEPLEIANCYEITPLEAGALATTWLSVNPVLGKLFGTAVIVGDSILSNYQTECGTYRGAEYLLQVDKTTYRNRGVLLRGTRRLSSWALDMQRLPQG